MPAVLSSMSTPSPKPQTMPSEPSQTTISSPETIPGTPITLSNNYPSNCINVIKKEMPKDGIFLGVVQGSHEHSTLCELNDAKLAMYKANGELRKLASSV